MQEQFDKEKWQTTLPSGTTYIYGLGGPDQIPPRRYIHSLGIQPGYTLTDEDWAALDQRDNWLAWAWEGDGVKATLTVKPIPRTFSDSKTEYSATLDFELE